MTLRSRYLSWLCLGSIVCTAAVGCATTNTDLKHGIGAGQWEARLPTTASPIHELAYGRGGSSQPADVSLAELGDPAELLTPAVAAKTDAEVRRIIKSKSLKRSAPANELALSTPDPAPAADTAAPPSPEPAQPQAAAAVLLAENDTHDRYAQREQQSKPQQQFRGGDAIVISAGALVVVLLIVILILLLVR